MRTVFIAVVAMCLVASAAAGTAPDNWQQMGQLPAEARVPVMIAVKTDATMADLEAKCMSVADPSSDSYGQYLSRDEVTKFLSPYTNLATVLQFLHDAGVADEDVRVGGTRDFVHFKAPTPIVEAMFAVSLNLYRVPVPQIGAPSKTTHSYLARSLTPAMLPPHVADAVDIVLGVDNFVAAPVRSAPFANALDASREQSKKVAATAPADAPSPPGAIIAVVSGTFYMYFQPSASTVTSYDLDFVINGDTKQTISFTPEDCSTVSLLGLDLMAYNTTKYMTMYNTYNYTLSAVNSNGRSPPVAVPMQWETLPASFTGVSATPVLSPAAYQDWYKLTHGPGASNVSVSVAEFGGQYYTPSDLATYLNKFGITNQQVTTLVGQNDAANPGIEAQMDIELIIGVAPGSSSFFWEVTPNATFADGWMLEWASQMSDSASPPLVTSISYGISELSSAFDNSYYTRTQNEFLKLCMRGLTVTVASGDAGATSDGHGGGECALQPSFPGSSAWVTSVSATVQSANAPARPNTEFGEAAISIATGEFWTTGGGFSILPSNRRPSYQDKMVDAYLSSGVAFPANFNKTGRAYPDVSSIGTNYWMEIGGVLAPIGSGTSSASPTFAGVVSLLNAARASEGKPSVGFINPLLYSLAASNPEVFYDVTVGSNDCGEYVCCPGVGYQATKGYDTVSGLGSVGDFAQLKSLVMAAADGL